MVDLTDSGALWRRIPALWRERLGRLGETAGRLGFPAALVGGCVRDLFLDRFPVDWDVVVAGDAGVLVRAVSTEEHAKLRSHPTFLTHTLSFSDGTSLDVATARTETYPRPAALPVVQPATLMDDFARRDFSVNAMALHITPDRLGAVDDPLGGRRDLREGIIRVLHDKSFLDDPTRIYRAARYAGRYGWRVEDQTRRLIEDAVSHCVPAALSAVRRRNELFHLLRESDPTPALSLLWDWGLWPHWDPTWQWSEPLARSLRSLPINDPLPHRLACLLGPKASTADQWLKSTATPTDLRRQVVGLCMRSASSTGGGEKKDI